MRTKSSIMKRVAYKPNDNTLNKVQKIDFRSLNEPAVMENTLQAEDIKSQTQRGALKLKNQLSENKHIKLIGQMENTQREIQKGTTPKINRYQSQKSVGRIYERQQYKPTPQKTRGSEVLMQRNSNKIEALKNKYTSPVKKSSIQVAAKARNTVTKMVQLDLTSQERPNRLLESSRLYNQSTSNLEPIPVDLCQSSRASAVQTKRSNSRIGIGLKNITNFNETTLPSSTPTKRISVVNVGNNTNQNCNFITPEKETLMDMKRTSGIGSGVIKRSLGANIERRDQSPLPIGKSPRPVAASPRIDD